MNFLAFRLKLDSGVEQICNCCQLNRQAVRTGRFVPVSGNGEPQVKAMVLGKGFQALQRRSHAFIKGQAIDDYHMRIEYLLLGEIRDPPLEPSMI